MLAPFKSMFRRLLMMAHHKDTDSSGNLPEQEMIRKASQVDPSPFLRLEMKPLRICDRLADERVQLLPEFVAQTIINSIVVRRMRETSR